MQEMKKEENADALSTDDEGMGIMPTIELIEPEKIAYVKGMEDYLQKLKSMPNNLAIEKSRANLESSHIIQEDGEFTERYSYSKLFTKRKG